MNDWQSGYANSYIKQIELSCEILPSKLRNLTKVKNAKLQAHKRHTRNQGWYCSTVN